MPRSTRFGSALGMALPHLSLWLLFCCAILGCAGPRSLREFPRETSVDAVGRIDPAGLGALYAGGRIVDIAAAPDGALLLAVADPGQVIEISPDRRIVWAADGKGTRAGLFAGPGLSLSIGARAIYLVDSGARRVHQLGMDGDMQLEVSLDQAMDAAASPAGEVFVFPNLKGYLLDVFDEEFKYLRSIVPLPGEPGQVALSSCLVQPDPGGGVFALWNPTRTLYRLGPEGERRSEFSVDPPELVANLGERRARVRERAAKAGVQGAVNPFLDLASDGEGRLGLLYLFERVETSELEAGEDRPSRDAAVYRFTYAGTPVDVIRGLGPITRVAFGAAGEIFGLDREANQILEFRAR